MTISAAIAATIVLGTGSALWLFLKPRQPGVPRTDPGWRLTALEAAEARRADLDAQVKAATAKPADDDDEASDDGSEPEEDPLVSASELKRLKADLAAAKKAVRDLEVSFLDRMKVRIEKLTPEASETHVRTILKDGLRKRLEAEFETGPRGLSDRYRTWADKYAVPLLDLERRRSEAEARFSEYLKDLGYV